MERPAEHERRDICRLPWNVVSNIFTNLLLSVKYYVSLRRNLHRILRRGRYHHSSWKKFRQPVGKKRKEKEQIVYNSTRNKRNTSKKSIRVRSGGSVYFSFPHLIESISSALRWPHGLSGISFIIRDRTNPLRFNNHDDYLTEAKARRYYTYCNERTKERAFKSCRLLFMRPSAWFTTGCIFYA